MRSIMNGLSEWMANLLAHSLAYSIHHSDANFQSLKTLLTSALDFCCQLRNNGTFCKPYFDILYLESFNGTLKPICTLEIGFSIETRNLNMFDLSNYQMSSWLSGVVQGIATERRKLKSHSGPSFFRTGPYESDVLFFFAFAKSPYI